MTERSPRILKVPIALTWPALGLPTIMPNCCCTAGIRSGGLHAAEFKRRSLCTCRDRARSSMPSRSRSESAAVTGREPRRLLPARAPVFRQQKAGDTVIRTRAIDVSLNHLDNGGLSCADRIMQIGDRGLFQLKWNVLLCRHGASRLSRVSHAEWRNESLRRRCRRWKLFSEARVGENKTDRRDGRSVIGSGYVISEDCK